ncbi:MAG: Ig-like domain-containing protein, partial [Acidobacteriota bacterium]
DLTSQIAWTADGIGFGSGGSASISTLAIGAHTINASVTDSGGQSATDTITVTVRDAAGVEGLDEDFESGAGGWTAEGLWHLVSSSGCSPGFNSPVSAFYYGSDAGCSYDSGAANQGSLVSPRISGIGAASTLSFAYRRQVESFNGDFDRTQVGISIDDGATFTEVFTLNATDPSQNAWISSPFISLTAFAGEAIRVRFLFDTVDATANGFLGWMIDDVLVTADTGSGSPPTVTINSPADGSTFDEGTAVTFAGTATDPEDGDLSAAIQWSVNGGAVATGSTFTSTLPLGANAVSASVTDSTGQAASDAITVNVQPVVAGDCLFDASFAAGADGFNFIDDPQTPAYTDGSLGAGTLEASAGGVDDADITDMIATWQRTCTNDTSRPVTLTVEASLTQSQDYESNELSELRLLVNGSTTVLATLVGDGNGPPEQTTGLQTFTADVNLPAGANTLAVACFNNLKTFNNELTTCSIDRVAVVDAGGPSGGCANGVSLHEARFETGTDGWTTDPAESCATGTFVVGTPDAVSNGGVQTQVGGAATGSGAFFTQPNTGGVGTDDVDAGQCSSLSPVIDTAGFATVEISFNYFHGQRDAGDDALDFFVVELSTDGGTTFQQALVSSVDQTSNAAWTPLSSMLPGGSTIRLRVRAGDGVGETDLVEAGLDDVLVCGLN